MSKANPRFRRVNPTLPLIGANTLFGVSMSGTMDGELWNVNLAYMGNIALGGGSEGTFATIFETTVHAAWAGTTDNTVAWTVLKVQCLNLPTRQPAVVLTNAGAGWPGAGGPPHLPKEMAAITAKQTPTKGQHGRGRNYWPGVLVGYTTPLVDPNVLNAAGLAAFGTLNAALSSGALLVGGVLMQLAIYTRVKAGLPVTNAQTIGGATPQAVRPILGTVRRRRPGRGR